MSSIPRYNYREHKLIINIKDWRKVPELANEIELGIHETGYWPEEFYCSIHTQPIKKIGGQMVIKFIGDAVTENIILYKNLI